MSILGILARFSVAAAVGGSVIIGAGAIAAPPASNLLLPQSAGYELTKDTGDVAAQFTVTQPVTPTDANGAPVGSADSAAPAQPIVLSALPDTAQITLVAYRDTGGPAINNPTLAAPWLNPAGHPRIHPITQFDGGPLANANCTMASGAMLARLAFGIVTTGSQLRALQPDQVGGSSLADLEVSIEKFGVHFNRAAISPLQLRALMYAGAGAEIQGTYGIIPYELRLQKNFLDGHAIYLDGFRPASAAGPAAYYVIDPLGHAGSGYQGAWWPADIVEAFALDFGGGSIYTAWAFPGGGTPTQYPQLPPDAVPGTRYTPPGQPTPEPTPPPSVA